MITYSLIIPFYNERQSLKLLYSEITTAMSELGKPFEIIWVDDGSTDDSATVLAPILKKDHRLSLIRFRANFGKSAALAAGLAKVRGSIIVTLDADLQDDPSDISSLVAKLNEGYDLICGWRKIRADSFTKRLSSFLFNTGTMLLTGVKLHDMNCGLKVFKKAVANDLYLHGELHRFIPVLVAKRKFQVDEAPVHHRPRRFGKSKYGLERSWRGLVDLLTAIFMTDYAAKPSHFFGKIGLLFFGSGFVMDAYVTYLKITTGTTQERIPLLLAGILFMVLGVQLLSTGLIAEMVLHHSSKRQLPYIIE